MVETPSWAKVKYKEMERDDFIEYILTHTEDLTKFRVHETTCGILVGIDRPPKEKE